ncbi:MAG: demethylmenaquinone methyltransferase [Micrococcales bacterium]|nr:demethylmenaquinone methyltransferase [Micrococcales bacterium]MCL2666583.1 demethylmenaquinone methyltransferase [Micrococcales bacterium]
MVRAGLDKRQRDVATMFDTIAPRYDVANDVMSLGHDWSWRRATVRAVGARPGEKVLDVAGGTGTSTAPYADNGARVVACDLSVGMLRQGRHRRPDLAFVAGDALSLPFGDASFDAVTISFGLRNVPDVHGALAEMLRVTRPGGRLVVCEFSTPRSPLLRAGHELYLRTILPALVRVVSNIDDAYEYLVESILHWPGQLELAAQVRAAGWDQVAYRNLSGGIAALHRGVRPDR